MCSLANSARPRARSRRRGGRAGIATSSCWWLWPGGRISAGCRDRHPPWACPRPCLRCGYSPCSCAASQSRRARKCAVTRCATRSRGWWCCRRRNWRRSRRQGARRRRCSLPWAAAARALRVWVAAGQSASGRCLGIKRQQEAERSSKSITRQRQAGLRYGRSGCAALATHSSLSSAARCALHQPFGRRFREGERWCLRIQFRRFETFQLPIANALAQPQLELESMHVQSVF